MKKSIKQRIHKNRTIEFPGALWWLVPTSWDFEIVNQRELMRTSTGYRVYLRDVHIKAVAKLKIVKLPPDQQNNAILANLTGGVLRNRQASVIQSKNHGP